MATYYGKEPVTPDQVFAAVQKEEHPDIAGRQAAGLIQDFMRLQPGSTENYNFFQLLDSRLRPFREQTRTALNNWFEQMRTHSDPEHMQEQTTNLSRRLLTDPSGESVSQQSVQPHLDSEGQALFLALANDPLDFARCLVCADYLEERGNTDGAAWLRSPRFRKIWRATIESYHQQRKAYKRYYEQYSEWGFPDGLPPLAAVLRSFSLEQICALRHLREPVLTLVPPMGFDTCVALLNERWHPDGWGVVSDLFAAHAHPAPTCWRAVFIESEQDKNIPLLPGEDPQQTLRVRMDNEKTALETLPGVRDIDRYDYFWLVFAQLERSGNPDSQINKKTVILPCDAVAAADPTCIPCGCFELGGLRPLRFGVYMAALPAEDARFCRAVGGEVSVS